MEKNQAAPAGRRLRAGWILGLLAAGALAGGIAVTALGATAAPPSPTSAGTSNLTDPHGERGALPVRGDEKSPTASQTATLRAAALKAVPGGTVYRVETDAGDGVYEAHMTKADGTEVTVKFDKNLALIRVENGMGSGDPGGHR